MKIKYLKYSDVSCSLELGLYCFAWRRGVQGEVEKVPKEEFLHKAQSETFCHN